MSRYKEVDDNMIANTEKLGNKLKKERMIKGITQEELAEMYLRKSPRDIRRCEKGEYNSLGPYKDMCHALNLDFDEFASDCIYRIATDINGDPKLIPLR